MRSERAASEGPAAGGGGPGDGSRDRREATVHEAAGAVVIALPRMRRASLARLLLAARRQLSARSFDLAWVGLAFLATRLLVFGFVALGAIHPHVSALADWRVAHPKGLHAGPAPGLLAPLVRWDALFYVAISRVGYPLPRPSLVYDAAFFPLYPACVHALTLALRNTFAAATLFSNACALVASGLLLRLGRTRREGRALALLFLCAPGSLFLSAPYSEALFCLLLTLVLCAAAEGRIWLGASAGALLTACRPQGVVASLVLGVEALRSRGRRRWAWGLAAVIALAGLAAYAAGCWLRYGDPLYFSHVQRAWGRSVSPLGPLRALFGFHSDVDTYLVALGAIALGTWMLRKQPLRVVLGAWFLILLPLSTGSLKSMVRFESANVPLLAGGSTLPRKVLRAVVAVSLLLLAYEAFRFGAGFNQN